MTKYFVIHENDAGTEAPTDAYCVSLEEEVERLRAEAQKWSPGVLSHVDFEDEPRCSESEMMIHIITPQGGVSAGKVEWRMVPRKKP